jgi:hypothetical protein
MLWWLSFSSDQRNLGVAVVEAPDRDSAVARGAALLPGRRCVALPIPDAVAEQYRPHRDRLMQRDEMERLFGPSANRNPEHREILKRIAQALEREAADGKPLYWLSFASETECLGVCLVEAESLDGALAEATRRGLNPGGEGVVSEVPEGHREHAWPYRNRLMPRAEAELHFGPPADTDEYLRVAGERAKRFCE